MNVRSGGLGRSVLSLWGSSFGRLEYSESAFESAFARLADMAIVPSQTLAAAARGRAEALPAGETWAVGLGETWAIPLTNAAQSASWVLVQPTGEVREAGAADAGPVLTGLISSRGSEKAHIVATDPLNGANTAAVDMSNRTVLADGDRLGEGDGDVLVIGGDVGQGLALGGAGGIYESIVLLGGANYSLVAADANVGAGRKLTVTATALGAGHGVAFDGSAEMDGAFIFHGGAGADRFHGGAGADTIYGLGGADTLAGGRGADRFVYTAVSESSGKLYDTLSDFSFAEDKIDVPVSVSGLAATVSKGGLSAASFDKDLAAALKGLAAGQAGFFTPDSGDLKGQVFLVVDANGKAGYQAGEDYVFQFAAPPPADLTGPGFLV